MTSCFRQLILFAVLVCFGAACHVHAIPGQPGTLDASWATLSPLGAGKLITPVGSGTDLAYAALLQPDGKILLSGDCFGGGDDFCVVRYLPTGALDMSFNGTGSVITAVGTGTDVINATLLQPDGKIIAAGGCSGTGSFDFCVVRYLSNGALDTSFNGTGKLITPVGGSDDYASAALLQPDGRIVLAGSCSTLSAWDFCVVRYLPTGALDTSFNGTGKLITPVGANDDYVSAALLQPDGKIVLTGYCYNGSNFDFCAVRYLPTGALDTSFNGTRKLITPVGPGSGQATAALLQPDGKIVLAGHCNNGSNPDFCVVRYLPTGALDTSFNGTGSVITPVGANFDEARAALLQPDGRIVLAGSCDGASTFDFCAVRYLPSGALDTTFNGTGKVITPIGMTGDGAYAALLQPDGRIVLAGACNNAGTLDFCSLRYDGGPFGYQNCKPDFDGDGVVLPTTDALILTRVSLGITGNAVVGGIAFAPHATRNTWPLIRDYLVTQCGMSMMQ